MKYPLSHNHGQKLGPFFHEILAFHLPPSPTTRLLDPTCGQRHLWTDFLAPDPQGHTPMEQYGEVVFADPVDYGYNLVVPLQDLHVDAPFHGIIYDPPYFFGYKGSSDPRRTDYGDYNQTYDDLLRLIDLANTRFPGWLHDQGKLIVKCADQYHPKERRFYPHHYTWIQRLTNFDLIDLFVFIHHRMSPTAFQVKNRPCSVIMHTYFLVFQKRV